MFYHKYDSGTIYTSHKIHTEQGTRIVKDHSISFGTVSSGSFNRIANTWDDWHLIPSSRFSVAQPEPAIKYVDVPGSDFPIDLTDYLIGRPNYGMRKGSFTFLIDNGHEHWEAIRKRMTATLHGKKLCMVLEDDPSYYYEGRFTVSNLESGASNSTIGITYQVNPYKLKIVEEGAQEMIWDITNFDLDYDYYGALHEITAPATITIHADDYAFVPIAVWISGSPTVSFGGVTETLTSGSVALGYASVNSNNTLSITGNGKVQVKFRYGAL